MKPLPVCKMTVVIRTKNGIWLHLGDEYVANPDFAAIEAAKAAADAAAKVNAVKKPTTITCIKGKLTKKVTGVNSKCPAGSKKK